MLLKIHSFIHYILLGFSRVFRSYARLAGLADSRRGADVSLQRPTSLPKEPSVPRGLPLSGFYLRLCT
jgi:hypothetical protein